MLRRDNKQQKATAPKPQYAPIPKPVTQKKSFTSDKTLPDPFLAKIIKKAGIFFRTIFRISHFTDEQKQQIDAKLLQMKVELDSLLPQCKGLKLRNVHRFPPENGNAWDYYSKVFEIIKKIPREDAKFIAVYLEREEEVRKRQKEDPKTYKQIMEKYKEVIELIKKGAYQQFLNRGENVEEGVAMDTVGILVTTHTNQFISDYMNYLVLEKKQDEALRLFTDTFSMNQAVALNGGLFSDCIYIANTNTQLEAIEKLLNSADFTYDALVNTNYELDALDSNKITFFDVMKFDRIQFMVSLPWIIESPDAFMPIPFFGGLSEKDEDYLLYDKWYRKKLVADWYDESKKLLNDIRDIENMKYSDASALLKQKSGEVEKSDNLIFRIITPGAISVFRAHVRQKANIELIKTSIAAKAYQQIYWRLPGSLNDLMAAGLLQHVPVDPYSNQPLRIAISHDRKTLKIYSIGQDMQDNGGDSTARKDLVFTLTGEPTPR